MKNRISKYVCLGAAAILAAVAMLFPTRTVSMASALGTWLYPAFICAVPETHTGAETHTGTETHAGALSLTSTIATTGASVSVSSNASAGAAAFNFKGAYTSAQIAALSGIQGAVVFNISIPTICIGTGTTATTGAYVYLSSITATTPRVCGS